MTDDTRSKLLPRNVAALRRFQDPAAAPREVTGNPVMTRLESGIGNCFPGLECDLRNLERRFFPFLEIEINFSVAQGIMQVAAVDLPGVENAAGDGGLPAADAANYRTIATGSAQRSRMGRQQHRRRLRAFQAAILQSG